ncbi:MAG: potassium channel family protein [Vulcanimicrobiota bacterium]
MQERNRKTKMYEIKIILRKGYVMKTLIVGCGRQGALLAKMLEKDNIEVNIIDNNPESFTRLIDFKGKRILGDGMKEDVLETAGIMNANAFVAVTNNDNVNLICAQIARSLYKVPRVVCRIYDPNKATIYSDFGLETVNFSKTGAYLLKVSILERINLKKFQLGDGSGIALEIEVGSHLNGKTVSEVEIPGVFRISSVTRGLSVNIVVDDFELKTDDKVFGVLKTDSLNRVTNMITEQKLASEEIENSQRSQGEE